MPESAPSELQVPLSGDSSVEGGEGSPTRDRISALRELISAVTVFVDAINDRYGLNSSESRAMRELSADGALIPRELSERTGLSSSTITNLVDGLERRGYVRRRTHPDDRRSVLIELTRAGSTELVWVGSKMRRAYDDIDAAEIDSVVASMRSIASALAEEARCIVDEGPHRPKS